LESEAHNVGQYIWGQKWQNIKLQKKRGIKTHERTRDRNTTYGEDQLLLMH